VEDLDRCMAVGLRQRARVCRSGGLRPPLVLNLRPFESSPDVLTAMELGAEVDELELTHTPERMMLPPNRRILPGNVRQVVRQTAQTRH
jgi:hypothetical protein